MESRFEMNKSVTVPPNVMIVLREGRDGYPASFPLLHGRIQGYWLENGTGGSSDIETLTVKKLRPATVDDIRSFMKNFPESKLPKLAHSIKISNENKLRELVTALVTKATAELRAQVEYHWPEGLTEKGIKILEAGGDDLSSLLLKMISIIIDDPMLTANFEAGWGWAPTNFGMIR